MWGIAGILAASGVIAALEVPSLLRKGYIKELWIFTTLLLAGTLCSIALALRVNLPNPVDWILTMYKPLNEFLIKVLN